MELRGVWLRVSKKCIDCRLNSCTALSSMLMLEVTTISLRGRKYLMMVRSSEMTTPQRAGLKEVRMECLAR